MYKWHEKKRKANSLDIIMMLCNMFTILYGSWLTVYGIIQNNGMESDIVFIKGMLMVFISIYFWDTRIKLLD